MLWHNVSPLFQGWCMLLADEDIACIIITSAAVRRTAQAAAGTAQTLPVLKSLTSLLSGHT